MSAFLWGVWAAHRLLKILPIILCGSPIYTYLSTMYLFTHWNFLEIRIYSITKMIMDTCTDKVTKARNTNKAMQFKIMLIIINSDNYLLWQLPGIACLNEDNGSLGWSGFGNGCNGFGRGCSGSTKGEAKNGPPRCEAKAKAWNCCCCPKRDNTAINREPVHWTLSTVLMICCVIFFPSVAN